MNRLVYVQIIFKKNLIIERIWFEVNLRVNYLIKCVFVDLEEKCIFDMINENVQFCVFWFMCEVVKVGMKRFVDVWNSYRIKGKKIVLVVYCCNINCLGVMLYF